MAESEKSRGKSCLKYGCFGCLAVAGLGLVVGGVIALMVRAELNRQPMRETTETTRQLPAVKQPTMVEIEPGREAETFLLTDFDVAEPGRIILDLQDGSFSVEAGPEGEPIRVIADYDKAGFELTESYESYGETGWVYRLGYRKTSWFRFVINDDRHGDNVRLIIPRGTPVTLEGEIGPGVSRLELGGLWLLDTKLELNAGEHRIEFDEPLLTPMKGFHIESSAGQVTVSGLGYASPLSASMDHSMGELVVDLEGPWARDAEIRAEGSMGAMMIHLPDDVGIDFKNPGIMLGEASTRGARNRPREVPGRPTLEVTAKMSLGELVVR